MSILTADYSNLDHEKMASEIGLKPKHIPILVGSFTDESTSIMQKLKDAIDANDFTNIKMHAHSIKGSAGNLKFSEVYEMAKEMELSAMKEDSSFDYKAYFDAVNTAILTIKV